MNRKKRIVAKAIFAVLTAVMLFACKPEGEKVTGVVLDHRELKADIGQTVTLTATVLPAEAADPKVSWEAVPKGIVELTADGALCTVKAVKDGAAVVTVTTEDGGFTAICTVTVLPVPAESVTLDRETVSLVLGNPAAETATLTATVFPENATDKTVLWSAEPADAVKLTDYKDGRCTVKALKDGTVTVTATAVDGGFTATCTVTTLRILPESVALDNDELKLIFGDPSADTATLTATVFPENAANKTVRWTVGAEGIVDLIDSSDGSCTLRARSIGNVTVTATAEDGGFTATCTVTVVPVAAESVELNRDELNLIWGDPAADTATLTATVFPENAANKTVSWSVDKTGCIDLTDNKDGSCTLRARSVGNVTVTATAEDGRHTATCTVTVTPLAVESVALDRDRLNLILGKPAAETATLTAVVSPGNAVNKTVIWSAEPAEMVSLTDNGNGRCTVKALKVGETVVTATAADGGHVAKCTVTVTSVRAERVELNSYGVRLILGNKETLTATLTATVFPENAPNKAVSWSVEPENIVGLTVGEDSRCTIRALNVGHAVVTVTAEDGGETASCRVTVSPTYAESIALNRETVDLILSSEGGETATLTATVSPENTTNKTVIWSAEPADAVKLTDNGNGSCTVEALKPGAVAVTATAADGSGHTATCTVTVSPVAAESVTLDRDNVDLILSSEGGETATLTATVSPENTLNKTIIWSAEPADAVKLTDNGNGSCTVEALKPGAVTVTATAADGSGQTATCTVTVAPVAAESVTLDREKVDLILSSEGGETVTLTATVSPENTLNKTVIWSAEPADAVKLTDNGNGSCTVEALKVGEIVVTATAEDGGHAATCTVTVAPVLPESVTLDREELDLPLVGTESETATLTATVFPGNALDKTVRWTASPEGVVALHDNGDGSCRVTALGGESAIVTAVSVANPAATAACRISVDYLYLTNTAFIKAVDRGTTSPASVGWIKENDGTVKLTPENLQKIRAVTKLDISEASLSDLGGIEYFTGLTYLNCYSNKLATLDVTKNTALTTLKCYNNNLTTLDVTKNTALTELDCYSNKLTTLDVSGCTALTTLKCYNNNLMTLDVTNNTALRYLYCSNNKLWKLDVSNQTRLRVLNCENNNLATLDVSKNTALVELYCNSNHLPTLDVSGCTNLRKLGCQSNGLMILNVSGTALTKLDFSENELTTLDASGCTKLYQLLGDMTGLTTLDVSGTALTELDVSGFYDDNGDLIRHLTTLDVSGCTALTYLDCNSNHLTTLDLSGCTALTTLHCWKNDLTTLDVSGCTALETLNCSNVNLKTLDASGCTALTELKCFSNNLTTLDVSGTALTELTKLDISYNNLTTLDVSGSALRSLDFSYNNLTTLDVSDCTALKELNFYSSKVATLDASGCTALTQLEVDGFYDSGDIIRHLTTLDVSGCTALTTLSCSENNLTTLDVTNNTALTYLDCNSNHLTTLDVTKNTALTELKCFSNNLTTLDVSHHMALEGLYCYENNLTTLDLSGCTALTHLDCHENNLATLDVSSCIDLTNLQCYGNTLTTLDIRSLLRLADFNCTPQRENPDGSTRRLTLKLTREQKDEFRLKEGELLKLEIH